MGKRNSYSFNLDVIRTIAIVSVILIHSLSPMINQSYVHNIPWIIAILIDAYSRAAVPLFIFLSGYLILNRPQEPVSQFFNKRLGRILIPFIFWLIIYYPFLNFIGQTGFTANYLTHILKTADPYYHMYYIYMILGLYLITPLLKILIHHSAKATTFFTIITLIIGSLFTLTDIYTHGYWPHTNLRTYTQFFPYIGLYLLGHQFHYLKLRQHLHKLIISLPILNTILTIIAMMLHGFTPRTVLYQNAQSPLVILYSAALFLYINQIEIHFKPKLTTLIQLTARYSFVIYFSHLIFFEGIKTYFPVNPAQDLALLQCLLYAFLTFVGSFLTAHLLALHPLTARLSGSK